MITIINYGSGNIRAIGNIYERLRIPYKIANYPAEVEDAEKIILPGVGAFDETMSILDNSGFRAILDKQVLINKVPVIGICVGMQILTKRSDEGVLPGLGWIDAEVKKFEKEVIPHKPKLPHMGWNSVKFLKSHRLFDGIEAEEGFYFLHSYYVSCEHEEDSMAITYYGNPFSCVINKENIIGVQFHPEKSHHNGIRLLQNFANL